MSLESGTRLGPYEIIAPIGAGGMGEVYRAKDTRLERTVAIKVLPKHLAESPERKERFEREAKAISQLNHPHICTLHDVGEQDGVDYLVMEYIEGVTLAEKLAKGALPLDKALEYAGQIADGLDKAHRARIVHRDLKPANVMLTKTGVKLLDFGLARLVLDPVSGASDAPTQQKDLTKEQSIVGTLQYMAPEQLEAAEIGPHTDIWAFGAVLYEMVMGRKAFEGKTQASLIGAIMTGDPPSLTGIQTILPSALDQVVQTCLAKDAEERWQSAGDIGRQLKWIGGGETASAAMESPRASGSRAPLLIAGAVAGALAAGIVFWNVMPSAPGSRGRGRYAIDLPEQASFRFSQATSVAVAPDGSRIVYAGSGERLLYLREINEFEVKPIPGSEDAHSPFFSPGGDWVAYGDYVKLEKVSLRGGSPVVICDAQNVRGASWGPDDVIVFSDFYKGLFRVSANGGPAEVLTTPDRSKGENSHVFPQILPGGKAVLFTIGTSEITSYDDAKLAVLSLETGEYETILEGGANAQYLPTGHIVFARAGSLMAVRFDLERQRVTGVASPVISGVVTSDRFGAAQFDFATNGTLAYVPGGPEDYFTRMLWVDRAGTAEPLPLAPGLFLAGLVSPDGSKLAVHVGGGTDQVWLYDLERDALTRFTFQWDNEYPFWAPDGERVVFHSTSEGGGWYWRATDGSGSAKRLLARPNIGDSPATFSPDGRFLAFSEANPASGYDIWVKPLGDDEKATPFLVTPFQEYLPSFSPDGNWLAYTSDESGQTEVYVRPFPGPGGKFSISTNGGAAPVWAPNGREIFYRNGQRMMVVAVDAGETFSAGKPELLFEGNYLPSYANVTPDGQRFLMAQRVLESRPTKIHVVLDWFEEVEQLAPTEN